MSRMKVDQLAKADNSIIATVDAMKGAGEFWNKYGTLIGTGSDMANYISSFMDVSKNLRGTLRGLGWLEGAPQVITDGISLFKGEMQGMKYLDIAMNIASMVHAYGSLVNTYYQGAKIINDFNREADKHIRTTGRDPWFDIPLFPY